MPDNNGFQSYAYAQKMRDIIRTIVKSEVTKMRPDSKYATVVSVDDDAGVAQVLFAGDTDPVPVRIYSIRPTTAGDVVRVEGPPARRFVTDVINGLNKLWGSQLTLTSLSASGGSPNMVINPSTGEVAYSTSSRKYKTNIDTAKVSDDAIKSLRAVTYTPMQGDEKTYLGVIAEELSDQDDPVIETLISRLLDGEPNAVNYDRIGVLLIPVVQRLLARVEELENKLKD